MLIIKQNVGDRRQPERESDVNYLTDFGWSGVNQKRVSDVNYRIMWVVRRQPERESDVNYRTECGWPDFVQTYIVLDFFTWAPQYFTHVIIALKKLFVSFSFV